MGMFSNKKKTNNEVQYLCFWHWMLDRYDCQHGCDIMFTTEELEEIKLSEDEWIVTIYGNYIKEFGDEINMNVSW